MIETHADGWGLLIPVSYCRAGSWPRPVSSLLEECFDENRAYFAGFGGLRGDGGYLGGCRGTKAR